ncbi:MAG: efflux RND transporter periplasmic adaptor subunit [Myxococcota bacterium]
MRLRSLLPAALLLGLVAGLAIWMGSRPDSTTAATQDGHAVEVDSARRPASGTWYTCGMHPEVVQDRPGECPQCGMKLQPMSSDRAEAMGLTKSEVPAPASGDRKILYWKSSMNPGELHPEPGKDSMGMDLIPVYEDEAAGAAAIRIDPVTEQNMGVRIDDVVRGPVVRTVRTVGIVDYDETSLAVVNTKVDGWIERLYVDQTGSQVHSGDRLFEIYSPALFSAQEEFLAALSNLQEKDVPSVPLARAHSEGLLRDARTRLEFFDISPAQIAELERTREVQKTLTLHAPFTGIVTQKNVVEGQKITAGMEAFRIADLSTVWVIGKVYEQDVPYVRVGQEALMTLTYLPGRTFRGRVTYIYPYLDANEREVPIRMEFHNPGYALKPGMYATIEMTSELAKEGTLVPDLAVIRTGLRAVAFVMTAPGRYEAREVEIGARTEDDRLQVLSGLSVGERVVVSGQFLLDSESRLREAALKFLEPGQVEGATPVKAATERAEQATAGEATERRTSRQDAELLYVCPMPGHTDVLYDAPGRCPICGMELVPVERHDGRVEQLHIAYWTCPMPEHAHVHRDAPGKCPICGMSLIPVMKSPEQRADSASEDAVGAGHVH